VLRQTYTDYELIVIDDGSTDDTRDRLKPYMGRIRYFYQDNRGASAAQNKGIELAIGKWVSILASDDVWLPTKLERQFETLATLGSEFGACFTNCNYSGNPDMSLTVFEEGRLKPIQRLALSATQLNMLWLHLGAPHSSPASTCRAWWFCVPSSMKSEGLTKHLVFQKIEIYFLDFPLEPSFALYRRH
jgi:glycosyltransferase involved in cell wall biosynthesis